MSGMDIVEFIKARVVEDEAEAMRKRVILASDLGTPPRLVKLAQDYRNHPDYDPEWEKP